MTAPAPLSDTDCALLLMLADGLNASEIGRRVHLSERQAQRRVQRIRAAIANPAPRRGEVVVRIPRQPAADPAQAAALTPLVREIARRCGDTPDVTAARRAALNAELARHERRSEGAAA